MDFIILFFLILYMLETFHNKRILSANLPYRLDIFKPHLSHGACSVHPELSASREIPLQFQLLPFTCVVKQTVMGLPSQVTLLPLPQADPAAVSQSAATAGVGAQGVMGFAGTGRESSVLGRGRVYL